jgi:hypothetical protein
LVRFSIETQHSPGCHYARCNNLVMRHASGVYAELTVSTTATDTQRVVLARSGGGLR